jgi:large subunit ribosomal protein L10
MYKIAKKHRITKKDKQNIVNNLKKELEKTSSIIVANYQGLTVAQLTEFKRGLAKYNAKFKVVRQKLFELAIKQTELENIRNFIHNAIGIIYCYNEDELLNILKYIIDYSKQNEKLKILGGFLYNEICDFGKIKATSSLPSKQELIAKMLQLLNSPINRMYLTLRTPISSLINILSIKSKKE